MSTKEIMRSIHRDGVLSPMSARAVALCEGCPMAAFCVVKTAAPCETGDVRVARVEAGGGYEGNTPEIPVKTSYRKELFDPEQPIVLAALQKKKELPAITRKMQPPVAAQQLSSQVRPQASPLVPKQRNITPVEKPATAGIVADILASMIGTTGIATARGKKGV